MRKAIRRHLSVFKEYLKLSLCAQLEYPTYFFAWLISNPLQFIVGAWTLKVVIDQFQNINGWHFSEVAFLYGLGAVSHGLSVMLFSHTWDIGWMVTEGEFDRMLVRPLPIGFQFFFSEFNLVGMTDLIPGTLVFIYGCTAVGFAWTAANTVKILLVIIGATLLRGGFFTLLGSLGFWTKRTGGLVNVSFLLSDKTVMYPISIYPPIIQCLFTFVLPLGFICFYPASEFLGKDTLFHFPGSLSVWTLAIGTCFFAAAMALFKKGLRKYDSAGS